jgi:hypothetical protein
MLIVASVGALAVVLACWLIWWLTRLPQLGGGEDVVKAVDALFTAVTARDEKLLGQCEQRLHDYQSAGAFPPAAAEYLDGIIQKARAGRWDSAAQRLYDFIKAQRCDVPSNQLKSTEKSRPKPSRK